MKLTSFSPLRRSAAAQSSPLSIYALLLINGMLVAGVYSFAKVATSGGVSPLGVLSWQVTFAAFVVGVVAALRGELPPLTRTNLRYAAVAGVLGITAPNLLTFAALSHLPAGLIGVIAALSPIFTYTIAVALRAESMRPARAAGIALGLGGVMAIMLPRGALPTADALPWALAAMAAPLLLAGGNLFRSLAWPAGLKPLSAASLLLLLQALVLVPLAVTFGEFEAPRTLSRAEDLAVLGAGAMSALFYLSAFELQKRAGPVVVGQLGYVVTVASLVIGALAFGESYPFSTLPAVGLVLAGVTLVNRRQSGTAVGENPQAPAEAAELTNRGGAAGRACPHASGAPEVTACCAEGDFLCGAAA